ncbi:MAG: ABC transporter permease [Clostridiales bacterium]|nr:ABC transporter permease [Clostridiales bacterium]
MKEHPLWRYGFLLEQLVKRNFNTKYRQSMLGVLWSFLNPLMTMAVQYIVFSTLFRSDISHFPVYLLTGIILFNFFNECVTLGMDSIVLNGPLITKVAVPRLIYPLSRSLSSLINLVISLAPLLGVMLLSGTPLTPALLLVPLAVVLMFLFALGMALILCTMNVFFRDTRFLWSVVSLLWTYATPIFYPISIIPAAWQPLFRLNPMYQFITLLRTIVIGGALPSWGQWGMCALCALLPLGLGLYVFRRNEHKFVFHL